MKPQQHRRMRTVLKSLPLIACVVFAILCAVSDREISAEAILAYTLEKPLAAAAVILLLYAAKSVSFVFPIIVLQVAAGHLFPIPAALLVNFAGRAVTLTIPYWIGRCSGARMAEQLQAKYPKLAKICSRQNRNPVFISFLLRTLIFLPGDAVSMYLGAVKIPFRYYLAGGVLGTTLGVVLSTVLGASITEPGSSAFWLSGALVVLVAVISSVYYLRCVRRTSP